MKPQYPPTTMIALPELCECSSTIIQVSQSGVGGYRIGHNKKNPSSHHDGRVFSIHDVQYIASWGWGVIISLFYRVTFVKDNYAN